MAPRLPMPRITLKRRPSSRNDSPGLSSVPASIEPIITLSAPAASAFTTSPEYLTPPSAITGTSPAPVTASTIAVICGMPTPVTTRVVQIEPGPTPTFTASTPRSTSARAPASVATFPPTSWASGYASRRQATVLSTPSECPCAESTTITSHPASRRARARARASDVPPTAAATRRRPCRPADRGRDPQAPVLILVGVRVPPALEDVLDRDEALEDAPLVHDWQLLDAVLGEDPLRFVEPRAHGRGDQAVLGHRVADRAVQLALELQVAVRDDPHQAPGVVHDRDARDAEPLHQAHRFAQRSVRPESDGVQDHPRLAALHAIHLRRLTVHGHVLVDDADAALARDRDRHLRFGDRIHRGGHEGDVEGDAAGKARAHVHVPRMYAREPRNEQNVVESESGSRPEGSHGESYWAGGVSSTLSLSVDCFAASSTAAFPAAATFSSNFPAFPTASIVPLMILTGTRPARSVSSSVSATRWNGGAPAGRSAYLDSRNST